MLEDGDLLIAQAKTSNTTPLVTVLVEGKHRADQEFVVLKDPGFENYWYIVDTLRDVRVGLHKIIEFIYSLFF